MTGMVFHQALKQTRFILRNDPSCIEEKISWACIASSCDGLQVCGTPVSFLTFKTRAFNVFVFKELCTTHLPMGHYLS